MKTRTKRSYTKPLSYSILLALCIFSVNSLFAQKFYGGEIIVHQTGTYSVAATVDLVSSGTSEVSAIQLCWGDGACDSIYSVFTEVYSDVNLKFHRFEATHVYGNQNTFTLSIDECCWSQNVLNITLNNPVNFQLSTDFFLSVTEPLFGENTMPSFERCIVTGNQGMPILYDADFMDEEGDEVHVEICEVDYILTYNQPYMVLPSPTNILVLDSMTGGFHWISPLLNGNYILALCVTESRNGVIISEYTRNLAIGVDEPLSNEDILLKSQVKLFPNPTPDLLHIEIPEPWDQPLITLFDTTGKRVAINTSASPLDLSHLRNGVYWLYLQLGDRFLVEKVVLAR